MNDKRPMGRPRKGRQRRSVVLPRVEPWVADTIDNDSRDGETRADTITRWAETRRTETS